MDGELVVLIRMVTEGGSFVLLCVIVLWMMFRAAPRHFQNQKEISEVMRATLADQRKAHSDERQYLRDTQQRQHDQNVDALARMARAIAGTKQKRPDARNDPDARPREG